MSFHQLFGAYPFSGAFTKFVMPPGDNDWAPKSWGIDGNFVFGPGVLTDPAAHFVTDGVIVNDVVYITFSSLAETLAAVVQVVADETHLAIWPKLSGDADPVHYKVGMYAELEFNLLMARIHERGIAAAVIHWSTIWTQAPFADFAHDETGDLYVCHNPGGKRLRELHDLWEEQNPGSEDPNPWDNLNPEP